MRIAFLNAAGLLELRAYLHAQHPNALNIYPIGIEKSALASQSNALMIYLGEKYHPQIAEANALFKEADKQDKLNHRLSGQWMPGLKAFFQRVHHDSPSTYETLFAPIHHGLALAALKHSISRFLTSGSSPPLLETVTSSFKNAIDIYGISDAESSIITQPHAIGDIHAHTPHSVMLGIEQHTSCHLPASKEAQHKDAARFLDQYCKTVLEFHVKRLSRDYGDTDQLYFDVRMALQSVYLHISAFAREAIEPDLMDAAAAKPHHGDVIAFRPRQA